MELNGKDQVMIPYVVYESMLTKEDTQQRRMVYIIVMLIVLLVVTNIIWLVAWNQYDYVDDYSTDISAEQDGDGVNIVGGGDIAYGTESSNQDTQNTQKSA